MKLLLPLDVAEEETTETRRRQPRAKRVVMDVMKHSLSEHRCKYHYTIRYRIRRMYHNSLGYLGNVTVITPETKM
jgi:hypothetical protein